MAIAKQGAILPNGNFNPQLYSSLLQAAYFESNLVPLLANHDYDGEISKVGDTVNIRKRPNIDIRDGVIGQDLVEQASIADEYLQLTIDYFDYFNVPVDDIQKFQADVDLTSVFFDQAAKSLATKAEKRVLQSIYTSATSTVSVSAAMTSATVIQWIAQCALKMDNLLVPKEGRWLCIDNSTAYLLNLSDLKAAYITGEGASTLRTYDAISRPIAGFQVYATTNLSITSTTAKAMAGHKDALCFASQINDTETLRNPKAFGDLIRGKNVYGFKVTKPDALCLLDISNSWTL